MAEATPRKIAGVRDLTAGPILGTLLAFAMPSLISNVLQSLNGSINAMWVGQLLGEVGLAATSNANFMMFMIFSLIFGFGMSTTILVGQHMGRRDLEGMRRTVGAGIGLFIGVGLIVAIGGWFAAPSLLHALATPPEVYPSALTYAQVMFLGLPAGLLLVYLQMALRGTGDSMTPLLFMIPGALIDVGLNPVLILGLGPAPRMGIAGSATATMIANYVSVALLLGYIYLRDLPIRLRGAELRYLRPARALLITIVRMGAPMGIQMIIFAGVALVLLGLVNHEGTATVAAYGAVNQLWTYIQMPAMAIGAAVSTMAAQNIGAGRWDRIGSITTAGVLMNLALTGVLVVGVTLPDRYILGAFLGSDGAAIAIARHINLVVSWSFVLSGVVMVLVSIPRANGATIGPLVIMTIAIVPGRVGLAYALFPLMGSEAIWWSFPIGFAISVVLTTLYYHYGGWRKIKLLKPASREEAEEVVQTESEPAGRLHPAG